MEIELRIWFVLWIYCTEIEVFPFMCRWSWCSGPRSHLQLHQSPGSAEFPRELRHPTCSSKNSNNSSTSYSRDLVRDSNKMQVIRVLTMPSMRPSALRLWTQHQALWLPPWVAPAADQLLHLLPLWTVSGFNSYNYEDNDTYNKYIINKIQ